MKPRQYIIQHFFNLMQLTSDYPLPLRDTCRCYGGAVLFHNFRAQYPDIAPEEFFKLFEEFSTDLHLLSNSSLSPEEQTTIIIDAITNDQPLTVPE